MKKGSSTNCKLDNWDAINEFLRQLRCDTSFKKLDTPLVFDVEMDIKEHVTLDPDGDEYQRVMKKVNELVQLHNASIVPGKSEIDKPNLPSLQPCCKPPSCICNFEA